MEIDFNRGKAYWDSLSFESRTELLKEGDFFNGFANYLWEYLIIIVQIYVSRRTKEINYHYEG